MIFQYGSYSHQQNSVAIRITSTSTFDRFRRRIGEVFRWDLVGVVRGTSQSDLTIKLDALKTAYEEDYKDWVLYLDDATTETTHAVESYNTFGGTKVLSGVNFLNGPWSGRPEYANQRTFTVSLGAETRIGSGYYSWKERLIIRGTGGSRWRFSPQISGEPQAQTLQTLTTFHLIQEGTLIARENWYPPPDPIYPLIEHGEMREIIYETPDDIVVGNEEMFQTSWRYVMENTAFGGFTNIEIPGIT